MKSSTSAGVVAALAAILHGLAVQRAPGADLYLDASATGSADGTTWQDAFTSAQQAIDRLQSGDTLWINAGDYGAPLRISTRSDLTIRMNPAARTPAVFTYASLYNTPNTILDGAVNDTPMLMLTSTDPSYKHVLNVRRSVGVAVRGLLLDRGTAYTNDTAQQHGIRIWDQSGDVLVEGCRIQNTTGDGVNITQITPAPESRQYDWVTLRSNVIVNVGDDGIQAGVGGVTAENNFVDNNGFPAYFGGHPDGFQLNPGMANVKVRNNTFRGFNQNVFIERASGNIFLYNNILIGLRTNASDRGMTLSVATNYTGPFVLANNTFYNFVAYAGILGGTSLTNSAAELHAGNNIFLDCKYVTLYGNDLLDDSNIYWDSGAPYFSTAGAQVAAPSNRNAGQARKVDPGFMNPTGRDLRLSPGSLAIDAGRDFGAFFTTDMSGHARGPAWDLGALEARGDMTPTRPRPHAQLRTGN